MTLPSTHSMFTVSIDFCNHSSRNSCWGNPRSRIVVLAKSKLQSMPSRSCRVKIARVGGIWKRLLECQDWSLTMFIFTNLKPLYFVTCSFLRGLHCECWELRRTNFCEVPPKQNKTKKNLFWRPKWHLIGVGSLKYWTLVVMDDHANCWCCYVFSSFE